MKRAAYSDLRYDPDDGLYYLGDEPFTGISYTLHRGGSLASEVGMREGAEYGIARRWTQDGILVLEREVEWGLNHGRSREWHPNGVLAVDEQWEQGICLSRLRWGPDGTQLKDWTLQRSDPAYQSLQFYRGLNEARWFSRKADPAAPGAAEDGGGVAGS